MENLMIKKLITLFKLGRKIAKSDILSITSKFQEPPVIIKILFKILSFSFANRLNEKKYTKKINRVCFNNKVKGPRVYQHGWPY